VDANDFGRRHDEGMLCLSLGAMMIICDVICICRFKCRDRDEYRYI